MMDLLFILIFAFMLKTAGDIDLRVQQKSEAIVRELDQAQLKIDSLIQRPPKEGKWAVKELGSVDELSVQEGFIDTYLYLRILPDQTSLHDGREVIAYSARMVRRYKRGAIYEEFEGYFDKETGTLVLKTLGITGTDGEYKVLHINAAGFGEPLGLVRFLEPRAVILGWASFPTNQTAESSRDGKSLFYGRTSSPDPNRTLTSTPYEASWIGPE